MSEPPPVSICIPAYNAERWLAEAIDSALAQTFGDFELLVSDNASTDGTAEIARGYDDPRIHLEQTRATVAAVVNHNRLIRLARGTFVKFLHADDLLLPDCVAEMVALASDDPEIALVFAPREVLVVDGFEPEWAAQFARPHERFETLERVNDGRTIFRQLLAGGFEENWFGEPSSVLLRRVPLERVGLLNERLFQISDLELGARLSLEYRIGFIDQVLSVYRHHAESGTAANAEARRDWLDRLWLVDGLLEIPTLTPDERAQLLRLRRAAVRQALRSQTRRVLTGRWSRDFPVYLGHRAHRVVRRHAGRPA